LEKAEIMSRVLDLLLENKKEESLEYAKKHYPFVSNTKGFRKCSPYNATIVFLRDGFIDRYSGQKLIFPGIFQIVRKNLPEAFPAHSHWKMQETHIYYYELFPSIDHIIPVARGGEDNEGNWITTSMIKNSSKANWTLQELNWEIYPAGNLCDWDGLVDTFLKIIGANKSLLEDKYILKWYNALIRAMKHLEIS